MAELTFVEGGLGRDGDGARELEDLPDAEALDAYSRTVSTVAREVAPSVANLRVSQRVRGGRVLDGGGSAVVITPTAYADLGARVAGVTGVVAPRSPTGERSTSSSSAPTHSPTWRSCEPATVRWCRPS